VLVGIEGLEVASRTSSFQFAGRDLSVPEIADHLKVRHILEGSVRKAGDTLRITAQLIDADNDRHLWSENFDRPLSAENVFAIQDEIASAIADALGERLGVALQSDTVRVRAGTENLGAYELFLQARTFFQSRDRLDRADELLARALELDPGYVTALEMRAALYALMFEYEDSDRPQIELEDQSNAFAEQALALDPNSAMALAVRALNQLNALQYRAQPVDFIAVMADFDRALKIDPRNPSVRNWRGVSHAAVGHFREALEDFEACVSADRDYTPCVSNRMYVLSALGESARAYELFQEGLERGNMSQIRMALPMLARLGKRTEFLMITNTMSELQTWRDHDALYRMYQDPGGDHDRVLESLAELARGSSSNFGWLPTQRAASLTFRTAPTMTLWDPAALPFRRTPAFNDYVTRSGILEYWREAGFSPFCEPVGETDFRCD
jgi:tetratricopeptide (TPR) repeat protein